MAAPRKPGKGSQLRESLEKAPQSPQEPPESTQQPTRSEDTGRELRAFTVRLPASEKERLERMLWDNHGENLGAGVRRIVTEWLRRYG
jgi:hypothetical protein